MAKHARTPQISLFEENQRRKICSELAMVEKQFGEDVVSQIFLHSVDSDFVSSSHKWVEQGDGSALKYLQRLGVKVRQHNRSFHITDRFGTFSFVDDHYFSGINFLLQPYASLFKMPFGVFEVARIPNSLRKMMGNSWDESKQHCGAVDYLVGLHKTEAYDMTLFPLKMLGGDFKQLRALEVVGEWVTQKQPVFSREKIWNASGKLLKFCVEGTTREEWIQMVLLVLHNDVDNQLCEALVKGSDIKDLTAKRKKVFDHLEKSLITNKHFDEIVVGDIYNYLDTYKVDMYYKTAFVMRFRQNLRMYYNKARKKMS